MLITAVVRFVAMSTTWIRVCLAPTVNATKR